MNQRNISLLLTVVIWIASIVFLLLAIVPAFQVNVDERTCFVKEFDTKVEFDCGTRCFALEEAREGTLLCRDLEKETLERYNPDLCHHSKWGFQDLLCPNVNVECDGGFRGFGAHTKCELSCPLSHDVKLVVEARGVEEPVTKIRTVKSREVWKALQDYYTPVGKKVKCQVRRAEHDIMWIDEHVNLDFTWWKWMLLAILVAGSVTMTSFTIKHFKDTDNILLGNDEDAEPLIGS